MDVRDPHDPKIPNWDLKSFPCLYPDGKNGLHQKRDVDLSMQACLQQRLLNVDGRFARHPTFAFAAFAANELNTLERNINISFMRGKKSTSTTGRTKYSLEDPYSVLENSPGTPVFFKKKRYELIAKMENLGLFHLFFTLSCGEKRYNENFTTFLKGHKQSINREERRFLLMGFPLRIFCNRIKINPNTILLKIKFCTKL